MISMFQARTACQGLCFGLFSARMCLQKTFIQYIMRHMTALKKVARILKPIFQLTLSNFV